MFGDNLKRGPQIITPKDLSLILTYTNANKGSKIVDAGTGSGFLAIFLAKYLKPCEVYTYENDERFVEIARENIKRSELGDFIKLKEKDITTGIDEEDVDLVTLDLKESKKVIEDAYRVLKKKGQVVTYSPTVEHLLENIKEFGKTDFTDIITVENIVREWKSKHTTRPKTTGILHTGFLTFAKKIK